MLIRYLSCFETLFIAIHIITYSICQGSYNQPILEQQQMCQCLTPTSCVLPSSQTTQMEKLEKTMPSGISWKHSGNWTCTKEWPPGLSKFKLRSPLTSECLTKLSLLKRLQHYEGGEHDKYEAISQRKNEGGAQQVLGPNLRMLEQQLNMGLMNCKGLLTWKQAWEEGEPTRQCMPGQGMKIQKLMCSPQVRNSPANSSKTRRLISKSQNITCSVWGDYQSFQTLSGSKYCKGRQLTSTLSSQRSTWLSLTTEQLRHSGTLNSDLDIWNQPKQSGTTGTGLLHTVCSRVQCSSSTPTESQNSYDTVSMSLLTLPLLMQEGKTGSLTSTRQSDAGLDLLTMCHLTSSRSSDSLKCATPSVRQQETKVHREVSKDWLQDNMEEHPHGRVKTCADCSIKGSVENRPLSVGTDTFVSDVERRDMPRRSVQAKRLEQYCVRGERPKHARKYLWKVNDEELGPTAGYSLTAKPLPRPSPMAESDPVGQVMILNWPDLFKIICKIDVNTLERLLTHHPNQGFVDSVLVGLCKGFWPFADMMKEGYLKLWDGSWCLPKSEKEHDFLKEQVQTKIATKHFSELFRMELLLGMYSPPVHAVPKPDSDMMCLVVDHSSRDFSPNSMITREDVMGVWLDRLHTLCGASTTVLVLTLSSTSLMCLPPIANFQCTHYIKNFRL